MTETKKCIYCGRSLDLDMIFCPRCGRPVPADQQTKPEEKKYIDLFGDKEIKSVPVMRTAHFVDTGVFPVIKEEDYPEVPEPVKEEPKPEPAEETVIPAAEEPAEETAVPEAEEVLFPDIPRINETEETPEAEETAEIPAVPEETLDVDLTLDEASVVDEDLSLDDGLELEKLKKERDTTYVEEVLFPELPSEKKEEPAEEVKPEPEPEEEKEPELPAFIQTERNETEEEHELHTAEIDVLGDLQSVLRTLIADDVSSKEEDVMGGPLHRDTRPSDSSYDVPFVLRRNPVNEEDTKTAMKLAGLLDIDSVEPAVTRKDNEETVMYENLFSRKEEKKAVDEGQTVVFQPVRDEEEFVPVHKAEEPAPLPVEEEPEKPAEVIPEKAEAEREELPAFTEPPKKKRSTLPLVILILVLLALLGVILYFLFFRGDDTVDAGKPAVQTAVAEVTPEPVAEAAPEPTEETAAATPEAAPEETAPAAPADDPDYFNTISKNFAQLYRAYLDGNNNGDVSTLANVSNDLRTYLANKIQGVNSGYRFKNRKIYVDRTNYNAETTADGDYRIHLYALAENDCTRLSDNVYIDNKPVISASLRYDPSNGEWYATELEVVTNVSLDGHDLVEIPA